MSRVRLAKTGAIGHLTLHRPDKRNALDAEMMDDLAAHCREVERDGAIRAVILSGEGRAFCAGGDIDAWSGLSPGAFGAQWLRDGHAALDALARLLVPVIAVLDGHALGGGLELAAAADYRIAERQIKIGQPETGLGVIPGWGGTQRAARRFGAQAVRRMALFGEIFTADEALALGIVDRVCETGGAMAAAEALAQSLEARAPIATRLTKMTINAAEGEERERILEALAGTVAHGSEGLAEGLAAFRDKRRANFSGKDGLP